MNLSNLPHLLEIEDLWKEMWSRESNKPLLSGSCEVGTCFIRDNTLGMATSRADGSPPNWCGCRGLRKKSYIKDGNVVSLSNIPAPPGRRLCPSLSLKSYWACHTCSPLITSSEEVKRVLSCNIWSTRPVSARVGFILFPPYRAKASTPAHP
ncbi:unnamed protein product [Pylaiella littoralis]